MKRTAPLRTDGEFGQLYAVHDGDVRRVVRAYRSQHRLSYRQAWQRWFKWAMEDDGNESANYMQ